MIRQSAKKVLLASAAVALAMGGVQPAFAHGGHYRHHGHHGHHYSHSYYGGHYRHHGYYGYRHHHHGGDAALIALGVVGGLVLLDSALESSRYSGGYYAPSYGYSSYGYSGGYSRYAPPPRPSRDYYYRQSPPPAPAAPESERDSDLQGAPSSYASDRAFDECASRARDALSDRGLMVASPAGPSSVKEVGDGAWRFKADFTTQDRRGGQLLRTMTCEADESGVRLLELI